MAGTLRPSEVKLVEGDVERGRSVCEDKRLKLRELLFLTFFYSFFMRSVPSGGLIRPPVATPPCRLCRRAEDGGGVPARSEGVGTPAGRLRGGTGPLKVVRGIL